MTTPVPKVDVSTCKKGSFWSMEIKSGKVKSKPECCALFNTDPAELPYFCPPTVSWCKWEESNDWSDNVKKGCCAAFGKDLDSCETKGDATPTKSIS